MYVHSETKSRIHQVHYGGLNRSLRFGLAVYGIRLGLEN